MPSPKQSAPQRGSFIDDLISPPPPASFIDDLIHPPAPAPRTSFIDDLIHPPGAVAPQQFFRTYQQAQIEAGAQEAAQAANPQVPVVQATLPQQLGKIWDFRLPVSFLGGTTGEAWKDWGRAIRDPWYSDEVPTVLKPVVSLFGMIEPYTLPGRTLTAAATSAGGIGPYESSLPIYFAKSSQLANKARDMGWGSWVQNAIMAGGAGAGMMTDAILDPLVWLRGGPNQFGAAGQEIARARTVPDEAIHANLPAVVASDPVQARVVRHGFRGADVIDNDTARSFIAPRMVEQAYGNLVEGLPAAPRAALQETMEAAKTSRAGDYAALRASLRNERLPVPRSPHSLPAEALDPAVPIDTRLKALAAHEESLARAVVAGQDYLRLEPPLLPVSIPLTPRGWSTLPQAPFIPTRIAGRSPGELVMTRGFSRPTDALIAPLVEQLGTGQHPVDLVHNKVYSRLWLRKPGKPLRPWAAPAAVPAAPPALPQRVEWAVEGLMGRQLRQSKRVSHDVSVYEGANFIANRILGGLPSYSVIGDLDAAKRLVRFLKAMPQPYRPQVFDQMELMVHSTLAGLSRAPNAALGYLPQNLRKVADVMFRVRDDPKFWGGRGTGGGGMIRPGRGPDPAEVNRAEFMRRGQAIHERIVGTLPDGSDSLWAHMSAAANANDPNLHVMAFDQVLQRGATLPFNEVADYVARYQAEMDHRWNVADAMDQMARTRDMHEASQREARLAREVLDVADSVFRDAPPLDWLRTLAKVVEDKEGRELIQQSYVGLDKAGVVNPAMAGAADVAAAAAGTPPPMASIRHQLAQDVGARAMAGEITHAQAVNVLQAVNSLTDESIYRLVRDFKQISHAVRANGLHSRVMSKLVEPLVNLMDRVNGLTRQYAGNEMRRMSDWWGSQQAIHEPNALGVLYNQKLRPKIDQLSDWALQQAGANPRVAVALDRFMNMHGQVNLNAAEDTYVRQIQQGYVPLLERLLGRGHSHQDLRTAMDAVGNFLAHEQELRYMDPRGDPKKTIRVRQIADEMVQRSIADLDRMFGGDNTRTQQLLVEIRPIIRAYTDEIFNGARATGAHIFYRQDYLPWRRAGRWAEWEQMYRALEQMHANEAALKGQNYVVTKHFAPEEMRETSPAELRYEIERLNDNRKTAGVPAFELDLDHNLARVLSNYRGMYDKMLLNRQLLAELHALLPTDVLPITHIDALRREPHPEQVQHMLNELKKTLPKPEYLRLKNGVNGPDRGKILNEMRDLLPPDILMALRGKVPTPGLTVNAPTGFKDLGEIVPSMRGWYVRDHLYGYLQRFSPIKHARGLEGEVELWGQWTRWMVKAKQIMISWDLSNFARIGALAFIGEVNPFEWARAAYEIKKLGAQVQQTGSRFERWTSWTQPYARAVRRLPEFREAAPLGMFSRGGHESARPAWQVMDMWLEPRKVLRPGAVVGAGTGAAIGGMLGGPPGATVGGLAGGILGWVVPGHIRNSTGPFDTLMFDLFDTSLKVAKYRQLKKAGLSPQVAADLTNYFMLDYSLRYLSPQARHLGYSFFPFFGWQTGNHLLHGSYVWQNPSRYVLWDHAQDATSQFWGETDPDDRRAEILRYAIATNLEDTLSDRTMWLKSIAPWHGQFRMGRRFGWGAMEAVGQGMPYQPPQGDLAAPAKYLVQRMIEPVRSVGLASSPFERFRSLKLRDSIGRALASGDYEAIARDPKLWSLFSDFLWGLKPEVHGIEFLVNAAYDPSLWKQLPRELQHDLLRMVFDTIEVERNKQNVLRPAQP